MLPYDIVIFKSDSLFSISSISTIYLGSLLRILLNELKNQFLDINIVNYFYDLSTKVPMGIGTSVKSDKLNTLSLFCTSVSDADPAGGASAPGNVNQAKNPMNLQNIVNPVIANKPKYIHIQSLLHPVVTNQHQPGNSYLANQPQPVNNTAQPQPVNYPVQQQPANLPVGVTLVENTYNIADPLGIGARGYKPGMKNNQPYAGLIGKVLQHCHNSGKGLKQPILDPTADRFFNSYISHHHPLAHGFIE